MNKKKHQDYDGFVEKFKTKKTTDDCYTPIAVYEAIVRWVREHCDIDDCEIIRPFYPGGDYENYNYPKNAVVIDNPPFSIFSKIKAYYNSAGIRYFLFAPHLTLFSSIVSCTKIVVGAQITYTNGADIATSFVSNMFDDVDVLCAPDLKKAINDAQRSASDMILKKKYSYPANVINISRLQFLINRGYSIAFSRKQIRQVQALDFQKQAGCSGIFGGGYLISNSKEKELKAKELKAKAKDSVIKLTLSEREEKIIQQLNDSEN